MLERMYQRQTTLIKPNIKNVILMPKAFRIICDVREASNVIPQYIIMMIDRSGSSSAK